MVKSYGMFYNFLFSILIKDYVYRKYVRDEIFYKVDKRTLETNRFYSSLQNRFIPLYDVNKLKQIKMKKIKLYLLNKNFVNFTLDIKCKPRYNYYWRVAL